MAKKLNKKVAITLIVLLILIIGGGTGALVVRKIKRNPDKALTNARLLRDSGDYENADKEFYDSVRFEKDDDKKIERLFEYADFHLIQNDLHEADWTKALSCWNTVISMETDNFDARMKMLDYYYQIANAGSSTVWKKVYENTSELIDTLKKQSKEIDPFVLKAHAKALLSMSQRGDSPNPQELLNESIETLNDLIERDPANEEYYQLMANASIVQGELSKLSGVMGATDKAAKEAENWLNEGVDKSDDKATATANLMIFKLRTGGADPNSIDAVREEIAQRSETIKPNDKLFMVTSIVYEQHGNMSTEAELNRAIDAIQQARELAPENAEYSIRMAQLLYRKGSAFQDQAAIADGIEVAEKALLLPTTQDVPGPKNGLQKFHRYLLNSFLADIYLEKAYAALESGDDSSQAEWIQKAEDRIEEIKSYFANATENTIIQKYEGMLLIAKGDKEHGIPLLFKAYEQSKALDKQDQLSTIDPVLCVTLADLAKEADELGMQQEFLEKAINNQDRIILRKPELILEYAELMGRLQSWSGVWGAVNGYHNQYPPTAKSMELQTKAAIGMLQSATISGQEAVAQEQLSRAEESLTALQNIDSNLAVQLKVDLLNIRIAQLVRIIDQVKAKNESPAQEQMTQLIQLRKERNDLLSEVLRNNADFLESQAISVACYDLLREGKTTEAKDFLDRYLETDPDNIALKTLRLQANEQNPLEVSSNRLIELQEQVLSEITDPVKRALRSSQFFRLRGDFEQAQKVLDSLSSSYNEEPDIIREKFELAVSSEDVGRAEELLRPIRANDVDGFQGVLSTAQVEIMKENYASALTQLDRCHVINPLSSVPYYLKSLVYSKENKTEEAVENARTASRKSLLNPLYARNLASMLFARNTALGNKATPEQLAEAEQAVRLARTLNPNDANLQSVYAGIISSRSPDLAFSLRQQLLESNPTVTNALMLGNLAMRMANTEMDPVKKSGLIESAGKAYQKALEIDPENEAARQSIGDYNRLIGKEDITVFGNDQNMLWKYYLRGGQYDQARDILMKLHEENPSDPLIVRGLIMTESGAGNRDKVKSYLDALSKLDPDKDTELWILQKYLDNGYAEEAAVLLASFKERYPEEKTALLIEAWTEMGKGKLDEALSLTNRYLEANTNNPGAWRLRGRLYRLMNEPQKAIKDLQQSKSIQPDPMVRLELATVYNETNQIQAAIGELKQGIGNPEAPVQLRLLLESIYQKNKSIRELEDFYQSTLEKFPSSTFWLYRTGLFYLNEKKSYKQAQKIFESLWNLSVEQNSPDGNVLNSYLESLSLDKQNNKALTIASGLVDSQLAPLAYAWMGQIQAQQEQKETAIESFNKALEKAGPSDTLQTIILEKMQTCIGKDAVVSWYEGQLAENAKSIPAHLMAYRLALEEKAYNKSLEHLDKCIEIIGSNNASWISLALKKANVLILAYTKTADQNYLNRSISLFEDILAIQPENPSLLNNMAYLLADNDQQMDRAFEYSRKAHQRDPGNPVFLDTYGYIQCKQGHFEQAEQNLLRAIQIYDVSKTAVPWDLFKHLGMAQAGLNKKSAAIESYKKALNATDSDGKAQAIPEAERNHLENEINRLNQS